MRLLFYNFSEMSYSLVNAISQMRGMGCEGGAQPQGFVAPERDDDG